MRTKAQTKLTAAAMVLGAALAGAALAPAPAEAIITGNGTSLNGRDVNGTSLNGKELNGATTNVRIMNGADPAGASFAPRGEGADALSTRALRVRELVLPDGRRLAGPRP